MFAKKQLYILLVAFVSCKQLSALAGVLPGKSVQILSRSTRSACAQRERERERVCVCLD